MRRIAAFAAAAVFAATPAQAFDVKSPGPDWTEAYHTRRTYHFCKGRR